MSTEPIDATQTAKNASCVSLAQVALATDSRNVATGPAADAFSVVQQLACLILIDALRDYKYRTITMPEFPDPPVEPPTPIKRNPKGSA